MNIRRFIPLMMAVALTMPAMAQKVQKVQKNQTKEAKAYSIVFTADKNKVTKQAEGRMIAPPKKSVGQPKMAAATTLSVTDGSAVNQAPKMVFDGEEFLYSMGKGMCVGMVPGMFYEFYQEQLQARQGVRIDEPIYRTTNYKVDKAKPFDGKTMERIAELQKAGADEKAWQMLSQYYRRTEDTKEICGMKAVRYEMTFAKGELWVAEDVRLDTWFAPFWGINHLVLEFDVPFTTEECDGAKVHLTATKVLPDETILTAEKFQEAEMISEEEMRGLMCHLADMLRN